MGKPLGLFDAYKTFMHYKDAAGFSKNTIRNYGNTLKKLALFFDEEPVFEEIVFADWVDFFHWLQEDYDPTKYGVRKIASLSPKTILNIRTNLSAFYTWAIDMGLVEENLIHKIERPRYEPPVIEPFTEEDIAAMLKACNHTSAYDTRPSVRNSRPTAERDRLIIALLWSTGLRASELCDIRFGDLNMSRRSIRVRGKGGGRGNKERLVYFGRKAEKLLWKWLTPRISELEENDHIITVSTGTLNEGPMRPVVLSRLISRIGERAGIKDAYPHRFRHTFAIWYIRNGGDLFTLQGLLGHSDLAMVRRYARLAAADYAAAHERADPLDNSKIRL
jgi:integrase/recombinase XerD